MEATTTPDRPAAAALAAPLDLDRPAWRLGWLTPARCRLILAAVLALGFVSHLHYLRTDCPIDLSGDEAQYWDWSRKLELSYYSKGPLVAYIMRASCAVFGAVMWAVRLPALVLGVGTSIVTYLLTRKLFGSERLALGAVLLFHIVPMFIAGSVMMTIDPPFFFCWALATYLAAHAIFDDRRRLWPLIGVVVGVGFLAKYAMFLWFVVGVIPALALDPVARRQLRTPWPWVGMAVALLFTIPVIAWNAQHGWVSARHVATQTGTDGGGGFDPLNVLGFLGGQIAVLGPPVALFLLAGVVYAIQRRRDFGASPKSSDEDVTWARRPSHEQAETIRRLIFLACIGAPFFMIVTLVAILAKVQVNWPAPAYFTLMILAAYFLSTRLGSAALWKPWRPWFYAAVVLALVAMPLSHNFELVYPAFAKYNAWKLARAEVKAGRPLTEEERDQVELQMRHIDPLAKLKGWQELGAVVSRELRTLDAGAFVMAEDYQYTGQMGFYVEGQPRAFCAGSYFKTRPKRASQYDMWPDRSLDPAENPSVLGRDAVYVGWPRPDLYEVFERVEPLPLYDVVRDGLVVRQFRVFRCHNFKGMTRNVQRY